MKTIKLSRFITSCAIIIILAFFATLCSSDQQDPVPMDRQIATSIPEEYQEIIRQAYRSGYLHACDIILFSEAIEITDQEKLQQQIEEGLQDYYFLNN